MSTGVAGERRRAFPLLPRRRLVGLPFGQVASRRRGHGSEVIGLRAYERGDPLSTIDWPASARVSGTSGTDAFVVRDLAADEAPRVVVVADRRPSMALYPEPLPWLDKRVALRSAAGAIAGSAAAAQADLAALDFNNGEPWWLPPGRRDRGWLLDERIAQGTFTAPDATLERAFAFLGRRRAQLPSGTFIFVLSDFLAPLRPETLRAAVAYGWDVVPVLIQDPIWEQSFPDLSGIAIPVVEPGAGHTSLVRLSRRQARDRRDTNLRRRASLARQFAAFGMQPVTLGTSRSSDIDARFIEWSDARAQIQRAR